MIVGLLLAAGAGSRMGMPKALVDDWLRQSVFVLLDGGCTEVTVVLGAGADKGKRLLEGTRARVVVAPDWAQGMGASLRTGLAVLAVDASAAVVSLVDLPDITSDVVRRLLAVGQSPGILVRATYGGSPGHPVLLGRDHWLGIAEQVGGDAGARDYLSARGVTTVECGDLATGQDVDSR